MTIYFSQFENQVKIAVRLIPHQIQDETFGHIFIASHLRMRKESFLYYLFKVGSWERKTTRKTQQEME